MTRIQRLIGLSALIIAATYEIGVQQVFSETVVFSRSPEPDVAGYKIYYGEINTSPTVIDIGNTTSRQLTNLSPGRTYFFYVTAYNTLGLESAPSSQITYTVPSGGGSNQPPTIIAISDRSVAEDSGTTSVPVSISDPDTAASQLTLSGSSSNVGLIANSSIGFSGTGTSRTLMFSPQANQLGTADITVTVSDGQASASDTFRVTVTPVNDAPTISNVSDQTIAMNSSTGPIPVVVSDRETASGSLTVTASSSNPTLVPQSGLILGGSGQNRTLTVQPASGRSGQATITLNVSDGSLSASDSFVVTVSGGVSTNRITEGFEGPGYENPGWAGIAGTSGLPQDEYTSMVVSGEYALRLRGGSRSYRELNGATEVRLFTRFIWRDQPTTGHTILQLRDNAGVVVGDLYLANGQLTLRHGSASITRPLSYSINYRYYVWLDWVRGSGNNGTLAFYLSSSSSKPASAIAALSTGTGSAAQRIYLGGTLSSDPSIVFDDIQLEWSSGTSTPPPSAQPPTIGTIADRTINEDSGSVGVAFTVSDPDTSSSSLTLSATSSNQALIPNSALSISGTGTNRTLTFSPQANQSGTADITVTASDGQASASDTFRVTVTPVNDAPTISNVGDQTIAMNSSSGPISVIVSDRETASGSLTLTASSSNPTLVPQSGLILGGSGQNRTLTVQPASGRSGQATITLNVSDGSLSASDSFVVTVSGGVSTNRITEGFEGPGYENPGWAGIAGTSGLPQDEYTSMVVSGEYALRLRGGSRSYRELNGATEVRLFTRFIWRDQPTTGHTILQLRDNAGLVVGDLYLANGQLTLRHGSASITRPLSYSINYRYYVWLDWVRGSGNNGTLAFYLSTSSSKPASAIAALSTGTGSAAQRIYLGGTLSSDPSIVFDDLQLEWTGGGAATAPAATEPPSIGRIANRAMNEDGGPVSVPFTVSDPDTSPSGLTFSATSSNQALIPNSVLSISGSGTNRALAFNTQPNANGTADLTITVSDGSSTGTSTFRVTVAAINDAPSISAIAAQTIPANGSTGPLPFSISDIETAATSLTVSAQSSNPTLIPQSGLGLGGSGGSRNITVTPAANRSGQATVTVTVSDGSLTASRSFAVTVEAPPSAFYLAENFEDPGFENPGWYGVGAVEDDYSTVTLEGEFGLRTRSGSQAYRILQTVPRVNMFLMFLWRESGSSAHTIIDLNDSAGEPAAFLWASAGQMHITHGGRTTSVPFNWTLNTRYRFWLEFTEGRSGNGRLALYVSTTDTKPATPLALITNGTGDLVDRVYFGGAAATSPSVVFDRIRMSDLPFGSNPQ